jgi:methyltransferase (TIGR00027 family)
VQLTEQQAALAHLQSAMLTAWIRAIETEKADGAFTDPYAKYLCNRPDVEALVVRTRLIDDQLLKEVSTLNGRCQVVLLGAGMDTRALRLAALASIPVFEIDLPLIMATKNQLMLQQHFHRPHYVRLAADLEAESWPGCLQAAGYDTAVPTIWIAEGLLTYLAPHKCTQLVQQMYDLSAPHSVMLADIPTPAAQGKNPRIRFTCGAVEAWLAHHRWSAVTPLSPERNAPALARQYASMDQPLRLFRAQKSPTDGSVP